MEPRLTRSFMLSPSLVCCLVDISWLSSGSLVGAVLVSTICAAAVALVSFCYVVVSCSWCLLSASCMMHSLVSFFHCYVAIFSISSKSGARHSGGHDSITTKITSFVAMNKSFTHFCVGSLCARIYRLCISTLNSVVLCKLL